MATATFYVNEVNNPPLPVLIVSPNHSVLFSNLTELLVWYPTVDPDAGDTIEQYHIQIDSASAFTAPLIDVDNITLAEPPTESYWAVAVALEELAGSEELVIGTRYYWRIRAQDSRYAWSDWSEGLHYFRYGIVPPVLQAAPLQPNGAVSFQWEETDLEIYIEFTPTLNPPHWMTIDGPIYGTNWVGMPEPGSPTGFYRLRME